METLLYIAACLGLPILWGVVVNAVFNRLLKRKRKQQSSSALDYQI